MVYMMELAEDNEILYDLYFLTSLTQNYIYLYYNMILRKIIVLSTGLQIKVRYHGDFILTI